MPPVLELAIKRPARPLRRILPPPKMEGHLMRILQRARRRMKHRMPFFRDAMIVSTTMHLIFVMTLMVSYIVAHIAKAEVPPPTAETVNLVPIPPEPPPEPVIVMEQLETINEPVPPPDPEEEQEMLQKEQEEEPQPPEELPIDYTVHRDSDNEGEALLDREGIPDLAVEFQPEDFQWIEVQTVEQPQIARVDNNDMGLADPSQGQETGLPDANPEVLETRVNSREAYIQVYLAQLLRGFQSEGTYPPLALRARPQDHPALADFYSWIHMFEYSFTNGQVMLFEIRSFEPLELARQPRLMERSHLREAFPLERVPVVASHAPDRPFSQAPDSGFIPYQRMILSQNHLTYDPARVYAITYPGNTYLRYLQRKLGLALSQAGFAVDAPEVVRVHGQYRRTNFGFILEINAIELRDGRMVPVRDREVTDLQ